MSKQCACRTLCRKVHTVGSWLDQLWIVNSNVHCGDCMQKGRQHLLASFFTQILIVPFHEFPLHVQVQRFFQVGLASHIQAQLHITRHVLLGPQHVTTSVTGKHQN